MRHTKLNGINPCRTKPGEKRRVEYQEMYSSADAAAFANVPKPTVYRALREGQLRADAGIEGHPRILHADLIKWMQARGFPVPADRITAPAKAAPVRTPMTPGQAAKEAGVTREHIVSAINYGGLRTIPPTLPGRQPRITQAALEDWRMKGKPRNVRRPALEAYVLRNNLPEFIKAHELTPKLIADRAEFLGLDRYTTLALLRGNTEHARMSVLACLLPVLSEQVGRAVHLYEIMTCAPADE